MVWEQRIAELKIFKAEHNHCDVPKSYQSKQLASWVKEVRRSWRRKTLTAERIAQLDELGLTWELETPAQRWDSWIPKLEQHVREHGNCNVPQSEGPLGSWVARQRVNKSVGRLTNEQVETLEDLGFVWDMRDVEWQAQAKRVQDHFAQNGTWASMDKPLKAWVSDQRRKKQLLDAGEETTLTASRVATLERIGVFNEGD